MFENVFGPLFRIERLGRHEFVDDHGFPQVRDRLLRYRRLVAAFEIIFGATIFFGTESRNARSRVVQRSRFNFLREARIWYARDSAQESLLDFGTREE